MSATALTLEVVDKRVESRLITSFRLKALGDWRAFQPGQHLVFRLANGAIRNYSLSGAAEPGFYRITVKREGLGSGFLHDQVQVGDRLLAEGPRGSFVLDAESPRPVVLLAGGVGLTPLLAMLHPLAGSGRRVLFLHAVESGADHALREEVLSLVSPRLRACFLYRTPSEDDRRGNRFHAEGLIDKALLQSLLPLDDYDVYVCGPAPFMQACFALLAELGVASARIRHESFGTPIAPQPAAPQPAAVPAGDSVTFAKAGITAAWDGSPSLLDFAEAQGLQPNFSCRAGVCGTCATRLVSGEVSWTDDPLDPPPEGHVLLCCTRPVGALVLE